MIGKSNYLLADKLYYLNKILNSCDLYHQVNLPDIFFLDHPVGSVMGRALYGDYFSFCQNCTVGNNRGIYPVIENHVSMCANSMIIGNCHIGDNVILGAGTMIKDENIPANSLVFGQSPNLIIKPRK
jgi:serine O-acetyltransferase